MRISVCFYFFFFNDTATTEIYTLSLHDALPISSAPGRPYQLNRLKVRPATKSVRFTNPLVSWKLFSTPSSSKWLPRSEEHTSELQSQSNLVCRLLLEKKKKQSTGQLASGRIAAQ